mmetsp:Transcript_31970/g.75966  ORF Transcript_31970/g.75966 Transcript_31970/m.75966 type:complete len:221 (+) Transcript_31970:65-727(+)
MGSSGYILLSCMHCTRLLVQPRVLRIRCAAHWTNSCLHARGPLGKAAARRPPIRGLLPQLLQAHVLVCILLHDLGDSHLEVLLGHVHASLSEGIHARLRAASLELGARGTAHRVGDLLEVYPAHEVHLARVDLEDVDPAALARVGELDLAVDAAGAQERGVEDVHAVGRHQHLDLVGGLEPVELVQELQHGPLHLAVPAAAAAAVAPRRPNAVDLVHEDD